MTAMVRPQRDESLRAHGLGFANSFRLKQYLDLFALPPVPDQPIPINTNPFIDNLWAPVFSQRPEYLGTIAEIRTGTQGTSTIARFYQELEGFLHVETDIEITKVTAGPATFIASIVVGVDLDTDPDPEFGIISTAEFTINTSNSNPTGRSNFSSDFPFTTFPGIGPKRYFDVGIRIRILGGAAETVHLDDSYGLVKKEWGQ